MVLVYGVCEALVVTANFLVDLVLRLPNFLLGLPELCCAIVRGCTAEPRELPSALGNAGSVATNTVKSPARSSRVFP
jgi:hypothetical protein